MKYCPAAIHRAVKPVLLVLFMGAMILGFATLRRVESVRNTTEPASGLLVTNLTTNSNVEAEISPRSRINLDEELNTELSSSQPLLPEDRPDWVAQPDSVDGDIHRIAIGTELSSSLEECQSKLDLALLDGVQRYVDEHLSKSRNRASKLTELNAQWIREHLMESNTRYAATLDRPAGTYHQLWVQLEIGPEPRATLVSWLHRLETHSRAGVVGLVAGGCVACLSLLNVGLGMFSKKL